MITNRSSLWPRAMAEVESDDPIRTNQELMQALADIANSHITAEFLQAEIPCESSFGYCDVCNRVDPFCPHQTAPSSPTANSISPTGRQPWGTPIANPEPCPHCGERPWWAYQDIDQGEDVEDILSDMYDWK